MIGVHVDGDIINRAKRNGPNIRAVHLLRELDKMGVEYTRDRTIQAKNAAIHPGAFNVLCDQLPACTPVGPNIVHEARGHTAIGSKFHNIIVQGQWVADYWRWYDPEICKNLTFYVWPSGVDTEIYKPDDTPKDIDCLWYCKYVNQDARVAVSQELAKKNQSFRVVEYGQYEQAEMVAVAARSRYCVYSSCCEKSPHALLEIMSMGLPAFVIDSKKWIGDDKFDQCTSAPDWSDECGIKSSNEQIDDRFSTFLARLDQFKPREYVCRERTIRQFAQRFLDIVEACHV